jgi:hypothetical protein
MTTPTPTFWAKDCWHYWGGCDPNGLDVALRAISGAFGFGPALGQVTMFLLLVAVVPSWFVLREPLATDGRELLKQVAVGLLLVGAIGYGAELLTFVLEALRQFSGLLVGAVVVAGVVALAVGAAVRSRRLVRNLRGGGA